MTMPTSAPSPTGPPQPAPPVPAEEATVEPLQRLSAQAVTLAYGRRLVAQELTAAIPHGGFTVIVGPNACGKSTLLRALARLLSPRAGQVLLDGRSIANQPTKAVARQIGLLPQTSIAPPGIAVEDLVARGRYPHQSLLQRSPERDRAAVVEAMAATGVSDLAEQAVDELSGGQRQRVWIAMALAQDTDIILLDEPTTFLDIAHQVEVLELLTSLNRRGKTVVAVLHDLNQAARYASHLIVMATGRVVTTGAPSEVMTEALVSQVFGLPCLVLPDPVTGSPLVVPRRAERTD
ncbi:MAG: ABC transporter ATP-binding protein [Propionibacteriaceae bacterium]|jgi:iron complex transport system ATP-binding protein|nr:ABC transporter ATP-binding protein [Propionibacteriaceae bacterium]